MIPIKNPGQYLGEVDRTDISHCKDVSKLYLCIILYNYNTRTIWIYVHYHLLIAYIGWELSGTLQYALLSDTFTICTNFHETATLRMQLNKSDTAAAAVVLFHLSVTHLIDKNTVWFNVICYKLHVSKGTIPMHSYVDLKDGLL